MLRFVSGRGHDADRLSREHHRQRSAPLAKGAAMATHGKIAVAGATGRVGRHVADVLEEQGYDVVAVSRSAGVDVVTGDGLADALRGVEAVVDATSGASPEQQA